MVLEVVQGESEFILEQVASADLRRLCLGVMLRKFLQQILYFERTRSRAVPRLELRLGDLESFQHSRCGADKFRDVGLFW